MPTEPAPRIRAGAIAWGVIVSTLALVTLLLVLDLGRRDAFGYWLRSLDGPDYGILAVLALGGLLLLLGLLGVIRRLQRRGTERT